MKLQPTIAGGLAVVYFFTQCVFAQEAEKSLWTERRRAQTTMMARTAPAIGSPSMGDGFNPRVSAILQSLKEHPLERSRPGGEPPALSSLKGPRGVVSLLEKFPSAHATVRKITVPSQKTAFPAPVVLLLEDVHLNPEAQENIGNALQSLIKNQQVGLVGLEGSLGVLPLPPFRHPLVRPAVKKTADLFLANKEISGALYAGLVSSGVVPPFLGMDSPRHYAANVAAYQNTRQKVAAYKSRLREMEQTLAQEKKDLFNGPLQELETQVDIHRQGKLGLGNYLRALTLGAGSLEAFPNVAEFVKALQQESALDLKAVEIDRAQVVTELVRRSTPREMDEFIRDSVAYHLGELSMSEFYARLEKRCARVGLLLHRHPALAGYLRYLFTADRVDAEQLGEELQRLEDARLKALTISPREQALVDRAKALSLVHRLLDFSLTSVEWRTYQRAKGPSPLGDAFPLEGFERFYREAEIRDVVLARNLLKAVKGHGVRTAVLVVGGFHTPGITQALTRAGATVVSATPKLTRGDETLGAPDLSVFAREKMPLDVLFQGEKLFVTPTRWSPEMAGKIALVTSASLDREGSLPLVEGWRRLLPGRANRFQLRALRFWNNTWVWIQNRRTGAATWLALRWNAQGEFVSLRSGGGGHWKLWSRRINEGFRNSLRWVGAWAIGLLLSQKTLQRKQRMKELHDLFLQMPPHWLRPTPQEMTQPEETLVPDDGIRTLHKIADLLSKASGSPWDWDQWVRSYAVSLSREDLDRWTYFLEEIQRLSRSKEWGWPAYGLTLPWADPNSSGEDVPPSPGFLFGVGRGATVLGKAASKPWVDELNRLVLDNRQKVLETFIERAFVMEQQDGKILEKGALVSRAAAEQVLEAVQKYWNEHQLSNENRDFEWVAQKCLIHPEGFLNYQSEFSLWRNYQLFKKYFGNLGLAKIADMAAEHLSGVPLARHREVFSGTYWTEEGLFPSAAIDVEMLLDAVGPLARVLYGRKNLLSRDDLSKLDWEDPDYQYFRGLAWALQENVYKDKGPDVYWKRLVAVLAKSIPAHRLSRFYEDIEFFATSPSNPEPVFSHYIRVWRSSYDYGLIRIEEAVRKAQAAEHRSWDDRMAEMGLAYEVASDSLSAFLKAEVNASGIPLDRQEVWNREIPRMGKVGAWEMWLLALLMWKFPQDQNWNIDDRHFRKLGEFGAHLSQWLRENGFIPWEEIPFLQENPEDWDHLVFLLKEMKYLSLSSQYNWRTRGIPPPWVLAPQDSLDISIHERGPAVTSPLDADTPQDEKNKKAFLGQIDEGIRFFEARAVDYGVKSFFLKLEDQLRDFQNYSSISLSQFYSWDSSLLLNQSIAQEVLSRIQDQWKEGGFEKSPGPLEYWFVRNVLSPVQNENLLWRNFKLFQKVADPQGFAIVLLTTAGHLRSVPLKNHLGPEGRLPFQTEDGPLTKGLIDLEFLFRSLGPVLRAAYPREGPPLGLLSGDPEDFSLGLYLRYAIANVLDPSLYHDGEKSHLDRLIQILRHNIPPQHRAAFFKDMGVLCDPQGDRNARFYGLKLPAEVSGSIAQYPTPESGVLDFTAFRKSSERINPLLLPYYRPKDGGGNSDDIEAYLTGIDEIKKAFEAWGRSTMVSDPRSYWIHSVSPVAVKFLIGVVAGMAGFPVVLGTLELRTTPSPHWQKEWEKDFSGFLALIDDELKKASLRPVPAVDFIGKEHPHMGEAGLFESQVWIHHFSPASSVEESPADTGTAQAWRVAVRLADLLRSNGSVPWDRLGDFPPGKFHSVLLILRYLSRSEKFGWTAHGWVAPWNYAARGSPEGVRERFTAPVHLETEEDPTGGMEGEMRKETFLKALEEGLAWFEKKAVDEKVGKLFQAKAEEGPHFDPVEWIDRNMLPSSEIQHAEPLLQQVLQAFLGRWTLPGGVEPRELLGVLWVPRAIVKERRFHALLRNYRAFESFAGPVAHAFLLLVTAAHLRFVTLRQHLLAFRKLIHTEEGDIPEGAVDVEYLFKSLGKVLEAAYPAGRAPVPMDPTGRVSLGLYYRYALLSVLDLKLFTEPTQKYSQKFLQILEKSLPPEHRAAFFQEMRQLADPAGERNFAFYGLRHPSDFSLGMEMSWFLQFPTMPLFHRASLADFLSRLLEPFGYSVRDKPKETAYFKGIEAIESRRTTAAESGIGSSLNFGAKGFPEPLLQNIAAFAKSYWLPVMWGSWMENEEKAPLDERTRILWAVAEHLAKNIEAVPWGQFGTEDLDRQVYLLEEIRRLSLSGEWGWPIYGLAPPWASVEGLTQERFLSVLNQGIERLGAKAAVPWMNKWKEVPWSKDLSPVLSFINQNFVVPENRGLHSTQPISRAVVSTLYRAIQTTWNEKGGNESFGPFEVWFVRESLLLPQTETSLWRNFQIFKESSGPLGLAAFLLGSVSHLSRVGMGAHYSTAPGYFLTDQGPLPRFTIDVDMMLDALVPVLRSVMARDFQSLKEIQDSTHIPLEILELYALAHLMDLKLYNDSFHRYSFYGKLVNHYTSSQSRFVEILKKEIPEGSRRDLFKRLNDLMNPLFERNFEFYGLGFPFTYHMGFLRNDDSRPGEHNDFLVRPGTPGVTNPLLATAEPFKKHARTAKINLAKPARRGLFHIWRVLEGRRRDRSVSEKSKKEGGAASPAILLLSPLVASIFLMALGWGWETIPSLILALGGGGGSLFSPPGNVWPILRPKISEIAH